MNNMVYSFILMSAAVLISYFCFVYSQNTSAESNVTDKIKVIVDVDAGVDDAMAILYLLKLQKYLREHNSESDLDILGITCVRGNTDVETVATNVLRTLNVVEKLDIPVYKGASNAILESPPFNFYFGSDGFGDVPDPDPPSQSLVKKEHAVLALIRLVNQYPGEVTILSLGPLTNIALAIRLDEDFLKKVKNIIILGGCIEGQGNIFPGVEYNFFADAEAVQIVLNSTQVDQGVITLFPWEDVLKANISWEWRKECLGALSSPEIQFINQLEHIDDHSKDGMWQMGDPMATMLVLNKDNIIMKKGYYGIVTMTSGASKGGIAVDYDNMINAANKIEVVVQIDAEEVKNNLVKYFS